MRRLQRAFLKLQSTLTQHRVLKMSLLTPNIQPRHVCTISALHLPDQMGSRHVYAHYVSRTTPQTRCERYHCTRQNSLGDQALRLDCFGKTNSNEAILIFMQPTPFSSTLFDPLKMASSG